MLSGLISDCSLEQETIVITADAATADKIKIFLMIKIVLVNLHTYTKVSLFILSGKLCPTFFQRTSTSATTG